MSFSTIYLTSSDSCLQLDFPTSKKYTRINDRMSKVLPRLAMKRYVGLLLSMLDLHTASTTIVFPITLNIRTKLIKNEYIPFSKVSSVNVHLNEELLKDLDMLVFIVVDSVVVVVVDVDVVVVDSVVVAVIADIVIIVVPLVFLEFSALMRYDKIYIMRSLTCILLLIIDA